MLGDDATDVDDESASEVWDRRADHAKRADQIGGDQLIEFRVAEVFEWPEGDDPGQRSQLRRALRGLRPRCPRPARRGRAGYRRLVGGLVDHADDLVAQVLGPVLVPPPNPITLGRFGLPGLLPASAIAVGLRTDKGRALHAGMAAHAITPFGTPLTGALSTLFAVIAHAYGWPLERGGSQRLAEQMATLIIEGGGAIETGRTIASTDDLPAVPVTLLDVMPDAAMRIGGRRLDPGTRRRFARLRTGPGVFKVDWALDGAIPWTDDLSGRAGTVHVGGTYEEIAAAETEVHAGLHPERPFVIVAQQSLFDDTRAPEGSQTAWGYCHVPAFSDQDMTEAIEAHIERFAPGFRDRILARHTMVPAAFQQHNPNYVGGDIAGGAFAIRRLLHVARVKPYRIGTGLYLCSSATPPGAGVHGMCGFHAARAALSDAK